VNELDIREMPRPKWSPLPRDGCNGVDGKVLLRSDDLGIATLRFDSHATIDEHTASFDVDVICLEGNGFVSVGSESSVIRAGETVRWPAGLSHRLWTDDSGMITIMVERLGFRANKYNEA
jgi:quercetin dioxygenase-like cupin family protein